MLAYIFVEEGTVLMFEMVPRGNILSALQGNFLTSHKKGVSTVVENQCDGVFSGILKAFAPHLCQEWGPK